MIINCRSASAITRQQKIKEEEDNDATQPQKAQRTRVEKVINNQETNFDIFSQQKSPRDAKKTTNRKNVFLSRQLINDSDEDNNDMIHQSQKSQQTRKEPQTIKNKASIHFYQKKVLQK